MNQEIPISNLIINPDVPHNPLDDIVSLPIQVAPCDDGYTVIQGRHTIDTLKIANGDNDMVWCQVKERES